MLHCMLVVHVAVLPEPCLDVGCWQRAALRRSCSSAGERAGAGVL